MVKAQKVAARKHRCRVGERKQATRRSKRRSTTHMISLVSNKDGRKQPQRTQRYVVGAVVASAVQREPVSIQGQLPF